MLCRDLSLGKRSVCCWRSSLWNPNSFSDFFVVLKMCKMQEIGFVFIGPTKLRLNLQVWLFHNQCNFKRSYSFSNIYGVTLMDSYIVAFLRRQLCRSLFASYAVISSITSINILCNFYAVTSCIGYGVTFIVMKFF